MNSKLKLPLSNIMFAIAAGSFVCSITSYSIHSILVADIAMGVAMLVAALGILRYDYENH